MTCRPHSLVARSRSGHTRKRLGQHAVSASSRDCRADTSKTGDNDSVPGGTHETVDAVWHGGRGAAIGLPKFVRKLEGYCGRHALSFGQGYPAADLRTAGLPNNVQWRQVLPTAGAASASASPSVRGGRFYPNAVQGQN